MKGKRWLVLMGWGLTVVAGAAEFRVSGLGWWENRVQGRVIEMLLGEPGEAGFDANWVEDACLVMASELVSEGYLEPEILVRSRTSEGEWREERVAADLRVALPRPWEAEAVELRVKRGRRYLVNEVSFAGLTVLAGEEAREFFRRDVGWFRPAVGRAFSPGLPRRAVNGLREELRGRGWAEARVEVTGEERDDGAGRVDLEVAVMEGMRWRIAEVHLATPGEGDFRPEEAAAGLLGQPWSLQVGQDAAARVRRLYQQKGYAEARVRAEVVQGEVKEGEREVKVVLEAEPGERMRMGVLQFEGNERTREGLMRRRVAMRAGEDFDPQRLEQARTRLARLGVFERVEWEAVEAAEAGVRDVVFQVEEAPRWEAALLMGYGSYEQARGGVEWRRINLWGRAHTGRLTLVQSMKSTRGEYVYGVPELFGERLDGSMRLFGLRREEQAFDREEVGVSLGLRRTFGRTGWEASSGYTFQALRTRSNELDSKATDLRRARVASVELGLSRDRRNNPVAPRDGDRVYGQVEWASEAFGGEVNYQRWDGGWARHGSAGRDRWWHVGVVAGMVTGGDRTGAGQVPVNRLYFPGGDSSIRGYQAGEAAPRGAAGAFVGARSQVLVNVELEQALTGQWMLVGFVDGLGTATERHALPTEEYLMSAGLGLRYQTLVGPVRLEYGHNLRRRPGDPAGTLHFSLGFPF